MNRNPVAAIGGTNGGRAARVAVLLIAVTASALWPSAAAFAANECQALRGGIGGTGIRTEPGRTGGAEAARDSGGIGGTGVKADAGGIGGTGAKSGAAGAAGRVLFVHGIASASAQGAPARALAKGDRVCEGDELVSGAGALLQLAMDDEGKLILRPGSRLSIETFAFNGKADGHERVVLKLQDGGVRAITGQIKGAHNEVRTPNARVSPHGTDHEIFFVAGNASSGAESGTYDRVIEGRTVLANATGEVSIRRAQVGFVPLAGGSPRLLTRPPEFLGAPIPPQARAAKPGREARSAALQAPAAEAEIPDRLGREIGGAAEVPETGQVGFAGAEPSLTGVGENTSGVYASIGALEAPAGTGLVDVSQVSGDYFTGGLVAGDPGSLLLLDANLLPAQITRGGTVFSVDQTTLIESGSATVDGVFTTWGVYAGGVLFDPASGHQDVDFHHFAMTRGGATPVSVINAISGSVTFSSLVGFTTPTTEAGDRGGSVNLSVTAQFGANPAVTAYQVRVLDAQARDWNGTYAGTIPLATFARGGIPLSATCSGAGCGSGAGPGAAAGIVIGNNAKGLITSYGLSTTSGQSVTGAAVLSRP